MDKKWIVTAGIVVLILAGVGALSFTEHSASPQGVPADVSINIQSQMRSAPFYIAQEKGYFTQNGLNVTIREYNTGMESLNAMRAGNANLSASSEYVIVRAITQGASIQGIATYDQEDVIFLIGRKDRGIANASSLKGKKIGLVQGSIIEFYLGRFLELNGMSLSDVNLVNTPVPQTVDFITRGEGDAVVTYSPYYDEVMSRLGNDTVVIPIENYQPIFETIAGGKDWIEGNPTTVARFIKSLDQANMFIRTHPSEVKSIVQKHLNLTTAQVETEWTQNQFSLSLDHSLVLAMEDETRWMIESNTTNVTAVPDFKNYLYTEGLESIRPGSVNILS